MKLENQVCTLEQSKKLSEFGIIAKSLFYWREYLDESVNEWQTAILLENKTDDDYIKYALADASYPAFTVSELGKILGNGTKAAEVHLQWLLDCVNSGLSGTVAYNSVALAGHIITQLENGTLYVDACNQRLTE